MDDKPPVKSYCGGKPNYCTPEETPDVDAVNMTPDRVDETVKSEHEPVVIKVTNCDLRKEKNGG